MRTLLTVNIDAEAGTAAFRDGTLPRTLESMVELMRPEAAYFGPAGGMRTSFFVFDLEDPARIPVIAEPFFSTMRARIEMTPVMNLEEVRAGMREAGQRYYSR
ncbi:hypothetical protein [Allostreptomyces psammosilenae]|uniref:Uncharacterized protein n=1 Tax=Allostreptomyces psammosilenae TaxID=1892865 RepID=A0A853A776_9ACTN|nr:hypothetical protein [Allostreptomyces psammosilenae]NYI06302.1 hypothetical protein [Allostreptomyces psammosilenae]